MSGPETSSGDVRREAAKATRGARLEARQEQQNARKEKREDLQAANEAKLQEAAAKAATERNEKAKAEALVDAQLPGVDLGPREVNMSPEDKTALEIDPWNLTFALLSKPGGILAPEGEFLALPKGEISIRLEASSDAAAAPKQLVIYCDNSKEGGKCKKMVFANVEALMAAKGRFENEETADKYLEETGIEAKAPEKTSDESSEKTDGSGSSSDSATEGETHLAEVAHGINALLKDLASGSPQSGFDKFMNGFKMLALRVQLLWNQTPQLWANAGVPEEGTDLPVGPGELDSGDLQVLATRGIDITREADGTATISFNSPPEGTTALSDQAVSLLRAVSEKNPGKWGMILESLSTPEGAPLTIKAYEEALNTASDSDPLKTSKQDLVAAIRSVYPADKTQETDTALALIEKNPKKILTALQKIRNDRAAAEATTPPDSSESPPSQT